MTDDERASRPPARFGHYELHEVIGTGGMGQVARATDTRLGRDVALKVMHPATAADDEYRARFQREAAIVARLTDPHVIPIHGYGEIDGRLYLDMRLVEGRNLAQLLDRGQLEVSRTLDLLSQIGDALDSAHRAGLVHRDVKPSNILVDPKGFAYLVDFGIAASVSQQDLTSTGQVVGSASYMAPERLHVPARSDARSDVYSLACVLYQALTGSKPFGVGEQVQVIAAHLNAPPPSLREHRTDLPSALDRVVQSGMAKDPAHRPASAPELMDAARSAMSQPRRTVTPAPQRRPDPGATRAVAQGNAPLPGKGPQRRAEAAHGPAPEPRARPGRDAAPAAGNNASRTLWVIAIVMVLICVAVVAYAVATG
ncbi:MAG TPA: protein kinase [Flexivirga sp.]|uniref:serine/threonine protein kinase n=1 Tax=Flexivirga sp. TaxID=1962927 RepID=UPI002B688524|nr:protein kinase [Flexivirga sp.]HWC21033.1 protein kinase [Flexivirga sp.]